MFVAQFHDARLYEWFRSVGLTPRKSLTLGGFDVAVEYLPSLLRGLLDGDGSILDVTYDGTGKARGRRYRNLLTRFYSASPMHARWLREAIATHFCLSGGLALTDGVYVLSYAKRASLRLLPLLYPDGAPCLARKREIWRNFVRQGAAVPAKMKMPAQVV